MNASLRLGWRTLWRDLRAGELRLLIVAVLLAVAALTAVGFFADRLQGGLQRDARQLLGGDAVIKDFVVGLNLSPIMFLIVSQVIIFLLGWPLEWTEIIVIFVPIFLPLLDHFGIDPLFFGLLIALNIQTSFLSPPVAMAPFYLKGVAPKHVNINDIFRGVMPYMLIVIISMAMLYTFPQIGLWLPKVLYK